MLHAPQQAHTTPSYATQWVLQINASSFSTLKAFRCRKNLVQILVSIICFLQKYFSITVHFSQILPVFLRNIQPELNEVKYRLWAEPRNKMKEEEKLGIIQ